MAATARCTSFICTSYDVVVFLLMAGSESAHSCSSVYPGLGSIYFRFHTAWWDHYTSKGSTPGVPSNCSISGRPSGRATLVQCE